MNFNLNTYFSCILSCKLSCKLSKAWNTELETKRRTDFFSFKRVQMHMYVHW